MRKFLSVCTKVFIIPLILASISCGGDINTPGSGSGSSLQTTKALTYTVIFREADNPSSDSYTSLTYTSGKKLSANTSFPAKPVKTGYTFGGWYEEKVDTYCHYFQDTNKKDGDSTVDHNMRLFARWTPTGTGADTMTVYYQDGSGKTETITAGTPFTNTLLYTPTQTGKDFIGWETHNYHYPRMSQSVTAGYCPYPQDHGSNVNLWPKWRDQSTTEEDVTVYLMDVSGSFTCTKGTTLSKLLSDAKGEGKTVEPYKQYQTFLNWSTDPDGIYACDNSTTITQNTEFFPNYWKIGRLSVSYPSEASTTCTISDLTENVGHGEIEIPSVINGRTVTAIDQLFSSNTATTTKFIIPSTVESIKTPAAFVGSIGLVAIEVSGDNTAFTSVDGILYNKDKSKLLAYPQAKEGDFTLPDSVKTIGEGAFYQCSDLSLTIPYSTTNLISIEDEAFEYSKITSVTLPDNVMSLGKKAFFNCTELTTVVIGGTTNGGAKAVLLPSSLTTIEDDTFSGCSKLDSVTLSNSIQSIGVTAFQGCTALKHITLPSGLKTIKGQCFVQSGLEQITIPASVTQIGYDEKFTDNYLPDKYCTPFRSCTSLTAINVASGNTTYSSTDGVLIKDGTMILVYPEGKADVAYTAPSSVTTLADEAFHGSQANTMNFPSVITLGHFVFQNSAITSLPGLLKVTKLPGGTFQSCSGLQNSIDLPQAITHLSGSDFSGCDNLLRVHVRTDAIIDDPDFSKRGNTYYFRYDNSGSDVNRGLFVFDLIPPTP